MENREPAVENEAPAIAEAAAPLPVPGFRISVFHLLDQICELINCMAGVVVVRCF